MDLQCGTFCWISVEGNAATSRILHLCEVPIKLNAVWIEHDFDDSDIGDLFN